MSKWPKRVVTVLALLAGVLIITLLKPAVQTTFNLPDGSTLRLAGITYGTNTLVQGSMLERLLGNRIPPPGINFLGWKLRRPLDFGRWRSSITNAPMTAWFELSTKGDAGLVALRMGSWKAFACSRNGRIYENGPDIITVPSTTTLLWPVPITAFPRTEKEFRLRLKVQMEQSQPPSILEFRISNPSPVSAVLLQNRPLPQTNQIGELQVILAACRT